MDKPLVSIVIPVYNVEKYLPQCLDSVLAQTYPNIEVITVNDGSPDNSGDILKDYTRKDERVKVLEIENQGLSGARNVGTSHCGGDYLMYLDSDDWIDRNTVELAVSNALTGNVDLVLWNYVKEYADHSSPVDVFGQKIKYDASDFINLYQRLIGLVGKQLNNPAKCDSISTAWGKLYKVSIIKEYNIQFVDTKIIGTEDLLFNAEYFGHCKTAIAISDRLNHYRKQIADSLARQYKPRLFEQWTELQRRLMLKCGDNEELTQSLSNRIALSLIGLGINEMISSNPYRDKKQNIKNILSTPQYKMAMKNIDVTYMPLHWKVFFLSARYRVMPIVMFLLGAITRITR